MNDKAYFFEIRKTDNSTSVNVTTAMSGGHSKQDMSVIKNETVVFSDHGIVYSYALPSTDKCLKGYMTHYAMIYCGKLWRCKSWGGEMTPAGAAVRSKVFAGKVARLAVDEQLVPPPPKDELDLENAALRVVLSNLVQLCRMWISSVFPRVGISWSSVDDYPQQLKAAISMLSGGEWGQDVEGE